MKTQDEPSPEGALNSESATSRAKIELAMRPTRSTNPRSKIILGTIEQFEKLPEKPVTTPWITEYLEYLSLQSSCRIQ